MDPNSGRIVKVASDAEARARGLVPIPQGELSRVRKMSMEHRRRWAETQVALSRHPAAPAEDETPEDQRKNRNARKRERRARRG